MQHNGDVMKAMRRFSVVALAISVLGASAACRSSTPPASGTTSAAPRRGGELLISARTEPRSFNRHVARDSTTNMVASLMNARLVRINKVTDAVEPWLAESWELGDQGRRVTMKLRQGVVFSDGQPFTADDVVFAFRTVYDERAGSVIADGLSPGGKKLQVAASDPHTVVITFPEPFAPGLRILEDLPILPRHRLAAALDGGTFAKAWGLDTPPADLAGLGPFVLREYVPGQRLVFERNAHYFLKAADGTALPYLDRVVLEIIPDQSAELLRLESGQLDIISSEISPDAYAPLKRAADQGRVKLLDLGVSHNADGLWFNLKPGAFAGDARAAWLQRDELRHAISMAVDRKVFADTVFLGAGVPIVGAETPANKKWYWAGTKEPAHDPAGARQMLASIGLSDRNGDGTMEDAKNQPVRFTLLTQKGRANLERAAAVIRDELKKIGVGVDIAALDGATLIEQFLSGRYEAVYFNADKTDLDPGSNPDFWFSSGSAHPWNIEQKTPATEWERTIDDLMRRQIGSQDEAERKRLYDDVQRIFIEHQPIVYFVAPRIYVAHSARVTNVVPTESRPQLLWRPEVVAVAH